jgi:AcrR family transcriptional regulator
MQDPRINDKREDILDIAERLFAEQGFEAVSVREISREAEINIAMISYYFGSKEKLYEEIIKRKLISYKELKQGVNAFDTELEKLMFVAATVTQAFFKNRNFQKIIFREMSLNQRTHMADYLIEHMHQNFQFITDIVKRGIRKKEFKPVEVELTVMSLFAIIRMYTTSGTMICKITNKNSVEDVYDEKQRLRLIKFLRDLFTAHLLPQQ